MHIKYFRTAAMSVILLLSNLAWAEQNKGIKVIIEEPAIGASYSGIANLRGWAVAPEGMTKYFLSVYIDGNFSFYMPEGFAHGFLCLSDYCTVNYKCSNDRDLESEKTLSWKDKKVNIKWPSKKPILSDKDKYGLELNSFI